MFKRNYKVLNPSVCYVTTYIWGSTWLHLDEILYHRTMWFRAGLPPAVWGGLHCKCPPMFCFYGHWPQGFMVLTNLVTYIDGPHFNRHPPRIPQMLKVKRKVKARATVKKEFPVSFLQVWQNFRGTSLVYQPDLHASNPHLCHGALMETTLFPIHWLCKVNLFSKWEKISAKIMQFITEKKILIYSKLSSKFLKPCWDIEGEKTFRDALLNAISNTRL